MGLIVWWLMKFRLSEMFIKFDLSNCFVNFAEKCFNNRLDNNDFDLILDEFPFIQDDEARYYHSNYFYIQYREMETSKFMMFACFVYLMLYSPLLYGLNPKQFNGFDYFLKNKDDFYNRNSNCFSFISDGDDYSLKVQFYIPLYMNDKIERITEEISRLDKWNNKRYHYYKSQVFDYYQDDYHTASYFDASIVLKEKNSDKILYKRSWQMDLVDTKLLPNEHNIEELLKKETNLSNLKKNIAVIDKEINRLFKDTFFKQINKQINLNDLSYL